MTIREICERIKLQPELAEPVIAFSDSFDFESIRPQLNRFQTWETSEEALEELREILKPDERNIKILACTLECATKRYEDYVKKGISDKIFNDTMGCLTRFGDECFRRTGEYACDREWWTIRQIGMTVFRLGELEFERNIEEGKKVINIHIPSDARITEENCDASIAQAKEFFPKHYPEYAEVDYICDSWLLAPALKKFLPETSNIIRFQNRFEIYKEDLDNTEFTEWLYRTKEYKPENFAEETSLQRDIKKYILEGGKLGMAFGRLCR